MCSPYLPVLVASCCFVGSFRGSLNFCMKIMLNPRPIDPQPSLPVLCKSAGRRSGPCHDMKGSTARLVYWGCNLLGYIYILTLYSVYTFRGFSGYPKNFKLPIWKPAIKLDDPPQQLGWRNCLAARLKSNIPMCAAQTREVRRPAKSQPENIKTPSAYISRGPFRKMLIFPDSLRTL